MKGNADLFINGEHSKCQVRQKQGKFFGKLVRERTLKQQRGRKQRQNTGLAEGGKDYHGFTETEIYHSKETASRAVMAFLYQQTTTAF